MSNFLAVATVTATLNELLLSALVRDVPGGVPNASVTNQVPSRSDTGTGPRVNVYLFRTEINASLRDEDLPTRRSSGSPIRRPRLALDLEYLLSFYGDTQMLIPQRLFGIVSRTLNGRPVLTREAIEQTIAMPRYSFLATSDLAQQPEWVKFSPQRSSIEDMSRIWHMFAQAEYRLSFVIHASVVLIDSPITTRPALPVRTPRVYVLPFREPVVTDVEATTGDAIEADSTLAITGTHLDGQNVTVEVAGQSLVPTDVQPDALRATLVPLTPSAEGVAAGPAVLHVETHLESTTGPRASTSSGFALSIRPRIAAIQALDGSPRVVEVQVVPAVAVGQGAALLLNRSSGPGATLTCEPPSSTTDQLRFEVPVDVGAGTYLARVAVDGVQSLLTWTGGSYGGPTVTLPAVQDG